MCIYILPCYLGDRHHVQTHRKVRSPNSCKFWLEICSGYSSVGELRAHCIGWPVHWWHLCWEFHTGSVHFDLKKSNIGDWMTSTLQPWRRGPAVQAQKRSRVLEASSHKWLFLAPHARNSGFTSLAGTAFITFDLHMAAYIATFSSCSRSGNCSRLTDDTETHSPTSSAALQSERCSHCSARRQTASPAWAWSSLEFMFSSFQRNARGKVRR